MLRILIMLWSGEPGILYLSQEPSLLINFLEGSTSWKMCYRLSLWQSIWDNQLTSHGHLALVLCVCGSIEPYGGSVWSQVPVHFMADTEQKKEKTGQVFSKGAPAALTSSTRPQLLKILPPSCTKFQIQIVCSSDNRKAIKHSGWNCTVLRKWRQVLCGGGGVLSTAWVRNVLWTEFSVCITVECS